MTVRILIGDVRDRLLGLSDESVHCVVTSPPYFGLRDYGVAGQLGLEPTPAEYIAEMVAVFREVRRVLRKDGTLWLNIGDSYSSGSRTTRDTASLNKGNYGAGISFRPGNPDKNKGNSNRDGVMVAGTKPKDLLGIPWMLAFALRDDGWYLRQDIIWSKPNPMPESVTDRCTKAHEYLFLMSKSERYYYDAAAIKECAETDDIRRPYGSEGSWALDGRPIEQRPQGKPRKIKVPGGWDTGEGAHGTINRQGRTSAQYTELPQAVGRTAGNKSHKYVDAYAESASEEHRTKAGLMAVADKPWPNRNKRSVWTVATSPYSEAHFATFPPALVEPCILAGCPVGGTVLDPFFGAGTTGLVADRLGRDCIGIELNPEYAAIAQRRIDGDAGMFASTTCEAAE